jgi:hypothetical protein
MALRSRSDPTGHAASAEGPEEKGHLPPAPDEGKSCPSGLCQDGALLLGVMTSSGRLAYVQPPTRIDAAFVARAKAMGRPEARFRFSAPCIEGRCPQWTGARCAVVDMVLDTPEGVAAPSSTLPACAIRRTCRWYAQRGAAACMACPWIVADTGGVGTYRSTVASPSDEQASEPSGNASLPPDQGHRDSPLSPATPDRTMLG